MHLLNHAPSGDFTPLIDSFGRVVFTQWDHLQRDQQADADAEADEQGQPEPYGTFDYADESASAAVQPTRTEVYPSRARGTDLLAGTNLAGHTFNQFFPWMILPDGTESEVLNHLGRHELHGYYPRSYHRRLKCVRVLRSGDALQHQPHRKHAPDRRGPQPSRRLLWRRRAQFGTHAAGQVISMTAPPSLDAGHIQVTYVTDRATASTESVPANSGHYRDPLILSDGTLVASHTSSPGEEDGSGGPLDSNYAFRLVTLQPGPGGYYAAGTPLTNGITATIRYWSPDVLVEYTGPLWELNGVEVRARRARRSLPGPCRHTPWLPFNRRASIPLRCACIWYSTTLRWPSSVTPLRVTTSTTSSPTTYVSPAPITRPSVRRARFMTSPDCSSSRAINCAA